MKALLCKLLCSCDIGLVLIKAKRGEGINFPLDLGPAEREMCGEGEISDLKTWIIFQIYLSISLSQSLGTLARIGLA